MPKLATKRNCPPTVIPNSKPKKVWNHRPGCGINQNPTPPIVKTRISKPHINTKTRYYYAPVLYPGIDTLSPVVTNQDLQNNINELNTNVLKLMDRLASVSSDQPAAPELYEGEIERPIEDYDLAAEMKRIFNPAIDAAARRDARSRAW